jgi:DNA-directed RNA polymerase specialized sigma24 family protein
MTHEERARAHDRKEWGLLWEQAIPLVKRAMKGVMSRRHFRGSHEDMLHDGYLAARKIVEAWNPLNVAFSTWVIGGVKPVLRDYIRRYANGIVGGRDVRVRQYGYHDGYAELEGPASFRDPAVLLDEESTCKQVEAALVLLNVADCEVVRALYGLGQRAETPEEFAARTGLTSSATYKRIQRASERLSKIIRNPL